MIKALKNIGAKKYVNTCSETLNMLLLECSQAHEQQEALLARIDQLEREKHEIRGQLS
jgi:hypothetical protein